MQVAEQFLNLLENRTIWKNKLQFPLQKTFPFLKILGYNGEQLIIKKQVIMASIRYFINVFEFPYTFLFATGKLAVNNYYVLTT